MGVKVNNSTNELGYLFRAERGQKEIYVLLTDLIKTKGL